MELAGQLEHIVAPIAAEYVPERQSSQAISTKLQYVPATQTPMTFGSDTTSIITDVTLLIFICKYVYT
jgi:hypothetical protein